MKLLVVILLVVPISWISGETVVGGLSEEKTPVGNDDPVLEIIPQISDEIKSQVAAKLALGDNSAQNVKDFPITVLAYKTQVVAGLNYFVKARVGRFIFHLRIYKPLPYTGQQPSLSSVKGPFKESDPLQYF